MIRKAVAADYETRGAVSPRVVRAPHVLARRHDFAASLAKVFAGIHLSIRAKILLSLCAVIVLMVSINAILMLQVLNVSRQYDAIITNIATANNISNVKPAIDAEMWKIVAGNIDFKQGKQNQMLADVNSKVRWMQENTDSPRAKIKLDVILRSLQTLNADVQRMGQQIAHNSTADENEALLETIRFDSSVVEDVVHDYVLFEVQRTEKQYQEMRDGLTRWVGAFVLLTLAAVLFSVIATWRISRSIYLPIKKLHDVTRTITRNDLQALMTRDNVDEITELGMSFNIMIGKIRELLDSKIREQENLKKAEMRALQAQINPHFLYNTLDTIIWMAESKKTDDVIRIVSALSNFFRISLSKGKDWITIGEEMERTRSYLTIQKMRYRDIMDFAIDVDDKVVNSTVLKLVLQPLVENALYHGLKNQRQRGTILVRARQKSHDQVLLQVLDNGIGIPAEKVAQINAALDNDTDELHPEHGFGLANVNKRIKLYYGKQYGLALTSEYQRGTCVDIVIPMTRNEPQPDTAEERP
jgi:two-component system sensor histidine kinase YesM